MSFFFLSRGHAPLHKWQQYTVSGSSKGTLVGFVSSNYTSDYPDNGIKSGYWYVRMY